MVLYLKIKRRLMLASRVNITLSSSEQRQLMTGLHVVADVFCVCCKRSIGWHYEHATDPSQKYKEGKFVAEKAALLMQIGY